MKKLYNFLGQRPLALGCLFIYILFLLYSYGYWPRGGLVGFYEKIDEAYADAVEIKGSGQLISKTEKNERYHYAMKSGSLTVLLVSENEYPIGSDVNFAGKVKSFSNARNDGEFDEESYYRSQGYDIRIEAGNVTVSSVPRYSIREYLYQLRTRIKEVYDQGLPGEEAGVMSAIAIGDKAELSSDVKDFFKVAGLSHILAISGLHVSLVGSSLYSLLRKRGISFALSGAVSGSIVVLYGLLSGWSISARRSVLMYLVYLLSQIFGRCYDTLTSLGVVAVISMLTCRGVVMSASFVFSYGAILGVTYTNKIIKKLFVKKKSHDDKSHLKNLYTRALFSALLCLFLMPITASYYFELPLYNILTSLLLLPLITPLLILGLLAGLVGLFYMNAAQVILYPCHFIIFVLEFASDCIRKLRTSTLIVGKPSKLILILFYLLILLPLMKKWKIPRKIIPVPLLLAVLLIVLPKPGALRMDFLDVGQGDGIYFETKEYRVFFDGGSTSTGKLGKNTLLPFLKYHGARSVDYWFITHGDADHVNGLTQILEEDFRVKNILLSKYYVPTEEMAKMLSVAKAKGSNIVYLSPESKLSSEDSCIRVLWPGAFSDDINENSLVLDVRTKDFSVLITGDIGKETEHILTKNNLIPKVDVLKVAHHGSKYSSDESFLKRATPTFAVISCSRKNRYGHPAPETVARLENEGIKIKYTMEDGQITIRKGNYEKYRITKRKGN